MPQQEQWPNRGLSNLPHESLVGKGVQHLIGNTNKILISLSIAITHPSPSPLTMPAIFVR